MKTLYFEGAGCVPRGDLENCRIRTAFTLDNGNKVYLEISGIEVTKSMLPVYKAYKNVGFVDHCFYITGGYNNENNSKVYREDGIAYERNSQTFFEYDPENLLAFVNGLGASFDAVQILPNLAGYRVHKDGGGYNFADEFTYDIERTVQAEKIKQFFYEFEKNELGKKFPNFSIYFDNDILKVLIHYNGFNHKIEIPDVYAYTFDYKKPEGATVVR